MATPPDDIKLRIDLTGTPDGENEFFKRFAAQRPDEVSDWIVPEKDNGEPTALMEAIKKSKAYEFDYSDVEDRISELMKKNKNTRMVICSGSRNIGKTALQAMIADISKRTGKGEFKLSPTLRSMGKSFPIMTPPGMIDISPINLTPQQIAVFRSTNGSLEEFQAACRRLSNTGFKATEVAEGLRSTMLPLPLVNKKDLFNKKGSDPVLYGRQQAQHWANKYDHKIRRKL